MTRRLYRWLLRLHPSEFRYRYAEEMQLIFDEAVVASSRRALFADAIVSVIRQWGRRLRAGRSTAAKATPARAASVPSFYLIESSTLRAGTLVEGSILSALSFLAAAFLITHGAPSGIVRLPRVVIASSNAVPFTPPQAAPSGTDHALENLASQPGDVQGAVTMAPPRAEPVVIGERLEIRSEVLNEPRPLIVSKPAGYDRGVDRYPVLYLLDGDAHFHNATGIINFLAHAGRAPRMLVVAVPNTNRSRDLTPRTQAKLDLRFTPVHGGADVFLEFLSDELIPFVESNYRTRPYKILIGHSHGGLFAIYALTTRPHVFNAYVAIDPSLLWNDQAVVQQTDAFFDRTRDLESDLHITAAGGAGADLGVIHKMAGVLEEKAPRGFRWSVRFLAEEDHFSIAHPGIYLALNTIFEGWHLSNPLGLYDKGGLAAVHRHFEEGGRRFGYNRRTSPFTISLIVHGLIQARRLEEAGRVLLHDPETYPAPWNQLDALARAYAKRGDTDNAIRFFTLSLKANPNNHWARRELIRLGVDPGGPEPHR